jgi:hypothetical protein
MDFRKWEVVNRMQQGRQETAGRSIGEEAAGNCFSRFLLQCLLSFICIARGCSRFFLHPARQPTRSHRHSSAQNPWRWDTEGRCEWWAALNGVEAPVCVPATASAEAVSIRGG